MASLSAQGLRTRPQGEARALSPAGPPAQPRPSGRLSPGAERPLRPAAKTHREPAPGGRAADPGGQLEAGSDPRRGRVRCLHLPRFEEDRDARPTASWQSPDRRSEAGLRPTGRGPAETAGNRRDRSLAAADESLTDRLDGATHFVAPTSACTVSTFTGTGRAFGRKRKKPVPEGPAHADDGFTASHCGLSGTGSRKKPVPEGPAHADDGFTAS